MHLICFVEVRELPSIVRLDGVRCISETGDSTLYKTQPLFSILFSVSRQLYFYNPKIHIKKTVNF